MRVEDKTKDQLVNTIEELHQQLTELERLEAECKRSESMLQKERDRAQNYLDVAGVIIVVIDPDQNVSLINKKGCDVLGYEEEDIIGKNWFDTFLPPGYVQDVGPVFQKLMAGEIEAVEYFENPVLTNDGDERLIAWHNTVLRDENGKIAGTLSSGEDITLRREAEDELRASEQKYSTLVEKGNDGIIIIQDGILKFANSEYARMLGCSIDDLVGRSPFETISEQYRDLVIERYWRRVKNDPLLPKKYEVAIVSKEGRTIPVELSASYIEYEGRPADLLFLRDISDRKRAEGKLRASEEKYSNLVEKSNDGIVIIQDYVLKFVNSTFARNMGYTKEETIGKPLADFVSEEHRDLVVDRYKGRIKNDKAIPQRYEVDFLSKDGRRVRIEVNASYIEYEGRPADMAIFRDITERKKAEEELRQSEKKYSTVVEKGNDGIIIIQDGVLKFSNDMYARMLGYTKEELIGRSPFDVIAEEYRELVIERYERRVKNDPLLPKKYEVAFISKDGRTITVELSASCIEYEGYPADMLFLRDITDRKKAEDKQRASEEKYSTLVEKSNDGILITQDYVLKFANSTFARTTGYAREEVIGKHLVDLISSQYRDLVIERYEKRLGKDLNIPNIYEIELLSKDGIAIPAEINSSFIEYEGKPATMTIVRDMTERKQAEASLKASEEKYSTLVEKSNDGIVIIQDYVLKFANSKFAENMGYTKDKIIGRPLGEFVSEKHRNLVVERYEKRIRRDTTIPSKYEVYFRSRYGKLIPIEVNASYIEYEGRPADMAIFRDITDRKKAEQALRASEQKYSTLVEKGNDGIVIIQDYILKFANERFAHSVGYARDEVIGKPLAEFISEEHRHLVVGRYEKRIKQDTTIPRIYEVNFLSKNGNKVPMEINASYIEYEGKPADMAIFRDITERKVAEDALRKQAFELSNAYEELKSLDKMKDEFLSNVGHELKTPLISIMGYGELMVDETLGDLSGQQKKAMDAIVRNSGRLRRLIDSLLYLSIIKSGKVKYRFEQVQVAEIIDDMVANMHSQVEKNGLRINKDVSNDLPLINADRDYLPQVLFNLIDNAIKFTPSGGLITVAAFEEDDCLHMAVSDTGIGIPKDMVPDIFKLFYQVDASTTRSYDGTGLGMYVCKQIIESHDGRIWVESEEDVGTTVHLLLPKK